MAVTDRMAYGAFIELHWECEPDAYYVRGHVTREQFVDALKPWYGIEVNETFMVREIRHSRARWIPTPHGNHDRVLSEPAQGRGSFAVTVLDAYRTSSGSVPAVRVEEVSCP